MTGSVETMPGGSRERLWVALILAVTFFVYAKALWNGYTYDDKHYAAAYTMRGPNSMIIGDHPVSEYFTRPMGHDVQKKSRGFRPVTVLSYAWTHHAMRSRIVPPKLHPDFPENQIMQEWSDPAWPHHLINLVLHLLATFFAYRLVRYFAGPGIGALGAAAVFGLHALRSDQVISIVGRGELLPFVFGAAGSLLYLHALQRHGREQWMRLALVLPCTMIAFFSKESAIGWAAMMPCFALVSHVQNGETARSSLRRQVVPCLVVVVIPAVLFFLLRARMLDLAEAASGFEVGQDNNLLFTLGFFERLPTAVMVWGHGLYKLCVPYPLACDYSRAVFEVVGYGNGWFLLSAAALLAILAGGVWCFRHAPLLFLGMAALLGFGFITSNIPIAIETIFGERLYYTPGLGVSFFIATLLARSQRIVPIVLAGWLTASAGVCVLRTFDWESNDTLFAADSDNQPRSLGMQMNMARVCRLREDWFGRERYLERALEIDPEYASARNDLAVDLLNEGQYEPALEHLSRALRTLEKNAFDLRMMGPEIGINIALAQQAIGKFDDAEKSYARVLSLSDPKDRTRAQHDALLGLAWLAWRKRDVATVEEFVRRCEAVYAGDPEAKIYRGALVMAAGDPAAAIGIMEPLLSGIPQSDHTAVGYETWIEALRALGRVDQAMEKAVHLGALLHVLRRDRSARDWFAQAINHPKTRGEAYRGLAWVAWELGGPRAVDEVLKKAMPLAPRDPELAVHGAMLAYIGGDPTTTVRVLGQLMPRMPSSRDFLRAWLVLGQALAAVGDIDNARSLADGFVNTSGLPSEYKKMFVSFLAELDNTNSK